METAATDNNGIVTRRNVERIQFLLPKEDKSRQIEVFFEETVTAPNGREVSKGWRNDPLILDLSDPKIIQALGLLKEVIEKAEWSRITAGYSASSTPSPVTSSMPIPGIPTPTPSPTPAAVPTPRPPNRPT